MSKSICILFFSLCLSGLYAQSASSFVTLIGDNEEGYEKIIAECPSLLLQVTNNSMDEAYTLWSELLMNMETSAAKEDLDLRGAKVWINLFWEADGSIKKIAYYPKPNSKNMDFERVSEFFERFAQSYQIPVEHTACFSHYGSASFPVYRKLAVNPEK